jgi:hypothetical protein
MDFVRRATLDELDRDALPSRVIFLSNDVLSGGRSLANDLTFAAAIREAINCSGGHSI